MVLEYRFSDLENSVIYLLIYILFFRDLGNNSNEN